MKPRTFSSLTRASLLGLTLTLISALSVKAEASDEMVINVRQTGPEVVQRRAQQVDVVSLRGDPNFVDRQFLALEEKDNRMFAKLEQRQLEGITVSAPRSQKAQFKQAAKGSKSYKSSKKVAGKAKSRGGRSLASVRKNSVK